MPVLVAILITLLTLLFVLVQFQLVFVAKETIGWTLSGEAGALLNRGVMTHGRRRRRTIEVQTILGHLALAARLNLPLPAALRAAARGERGRVARSLGKMAYSLSMGYPVSEAVAAGVPGCSFLLRSTLEKGEQCGQLTQALADVERMLGDVTRDEHGLSGRFANAGAYAAYMLVFCLFVMISIMVRIVPMFKDIFVDFDTELPWITRSLISTCDWLWESGLGNLLLFGVLPLVLLGAVLSCTTALLRAWRTDEPPLFLRTIGALRWSIPLTRHIDFGLGMARAIRTLSFRLRAGLEVDRAADLASTVSWTNHLRYRLGDFAAEVRGGVPPRVAANRAGLGDVFTSALAMIERGEDAETALAHAAEYYRAVAFRWWRALAALSGPMVTLLIALLVGYIVLALFLPLVTLINSVAESIV